MADFKVELLAELIMSGAYDQIKQLESQPVHLQVELDGLKEQTAEFKKLTKELKDYQKISKQQQSLPVGFDQKQINQITTAFGRLETSINNIQKAFGTLDDSANMQPMLASINSISSALSDTKAEFQSLSAAMNNMQFNVNLSFGSGGSAVGRSAKYGSQMRNTVLPQLQEQAKALEDLFGGRGGAWSLLMRDANMFTRLPELLNQLGDTSNLSRAADAGREYIGILMRLAQAQKIDLSGFREQFTQTPDQLISGAHKILDSTNDIEQNAKRMRDTLGNLFGGTQSQVNLDGTAISNQLTEIVNKLGQVEAAITQLSTGGNLNDLTVAFNNVSDSLRQIVTDCNLVRTAMQNMTGGQSGSTASSLQEVQKTAEAASHNLLALQSTLKGQGLDDDSIKRVTDDLTDMNLQVDKIRVNSKDGDMFSVSVEGIDQYNNRLVDTITYTRKLNKVTGEMEWSASHKQSATLNYGVTAKETSEAEQNYQRMKDLITRRNKLLKQKAKSEGETPELDRQLQENFEEYQRLYQDHYNELNAQQRKYLNQRQQLNADEKRLADEAVANAKREADAKKALKDAEKADSSYQSVAKDIESDSYRIEKAMADIREQTTETAKAYSAYKAAEADMKSVDATTDTATKIARTQKYEEALRKVTLEIQKNIDAQKKQSKETGLSLKKDAFSSEIDVWANKNSEAAKHFSAELDSIRMRIRECDAEGLTNLRTEFTKLKRDAEAAGKTAKTFGHQMRDMMQQLTMFFSLDYIVDRAVDGLRDMYQQVVEIDTAMTDLLKVTDESAARYEKFMGSASDSSKELGRSMSSYITQTAEWSKMGYGLDQAEELSKLSSIYSNVGEVNDETAVSDMVTAMKAYNIEASEATKIIDSLNKLGNEFAVTAAGLGSGMANSASAMATAGVSFEQTMAMITGIAEITQSPAEAGSFLKIASMRIRGMKGALEELGEEVDENVDSISKVQTQILNLTGGKVNIFDQNGEFRNYFEIMKEIASVYNDLSSTDQATLTEILFGKMRGNQGAAMIQAFQSGQITKAFEAAMNSAGSAAAEQAKWMESLEARIGKLKASWQSLSETFMSSDFLKGLMDFGIGFMDTIEGVIENIGVIPTILTAVTAGLSLKDVGELIKQFHCAITLANEYAHEAA